MYDVVDWWCMVWWTGGVWCDRVEVYGVVEVYSVVEWRCMM